MDRSDGALEDVGRARFLSIQLSDGSVARGEGGG